MVRASIYTMTALCMLCVQGCDLRPNQPPQGKGIDHTVQATRDRQAIDIREAVIRHLIGKYMMRAPDAKFIFLDVGSTVYGSPPTLLLSRFQGHIPPVRWVEQATSFYDGVKDKETNKKGIILRAGLINWLGDSDIEIQAGYRINGKNGYHCTYHLTRQYDEWIVVNESNGVRI